MAAENGAFRERKLLRESRFYRVAESTSARLEKPLKNPIYSIVY
jgi:hypothetical protein